MDAETNSVPGPMRQPRQAIARAKPAALEKPARGGVDVLASDARTNGCERRLLGAFFYCPHALDLFRRLAEHISAGDIRMIAANLTAGIDEHHVALAQGLISRHTVRIRGCLGELNRTKIAAGVRAQPPVRRIDELFHLARLDARGENARRPTLHLERH